MITLGNTILTFLGNWALEMLTERGLGRIRYLLGQKSKPQHLSSKAQEIASAFDLYSNKYLRYTRASIPGIGRLERPQIAEIEKAWKEGVNSVLLVGDAGSGKSGIAELLATRLIQEQTPVLLLRATDLAQHQDPVVFIKNRLPVQVDNLVEMYTILGKEKNCVLIIDQLDSVVGTEILISLTTFLRTVDSLPGVRVLAISRSLEANDIPKIKDLNFPKIYSQEISLQTAHNYLKRLDVDTPDSTLLSLAQNLLNLSLIAEIVKTSEKKLEQRVSLAQLWETYLQTITEREGQATLDLAFRFADEQLIKGERDFPLSFSQAIELRRLRSRNVLVQSKFGWYRFRHDQLQDFLCAYWLFPQRPTATGIIQRYGQHFGKGVLRWIHSLYHLHALDEEAEFVNQVLVDKSIPFYVRASILDNLKAIPEPNARLAQVLTYWLLSDRAYEDYFFQGLENLAWVSPLYEAGCFSQVPPPVEVHQGQFQLPLWFAGQYLANHAEKIPHIVLDVALHLQTDNERVFETMLHALRKIEPSLSAQAAYAVVDWLKTPFARLLTTEPGQYMGYLTENNQTNAALTVLNGLLAIEKSLRKPIENNYSYQEISSRYEDYWLEEIIEKYLPELIKADPIGVIGVTEKQLIQAIELELGTTERETNNGSYSYWRDAIEGPFSEQRSQKLKDLLVDSLRDSLLDASNQAPGDLEDIIQRYLRSPHSILRRLAIYILVQCEGLFFHLIPGIFVDEQFLNQNSNEHEFYIFMKTQFGKLNETEQRKFLNWLLQGPPMIQERLEHIEQWGNRTVTEEDVVGLREYWLLPRLNLIRDFLPEDSLNLLEKLVAKRGEPVDLELVEERIRVSWGSVSPIPVEELQKLSVQELVELLQDYQPSSNSFSESHESLASGIHTLIQDSPTPYAENAHLFLSPRLKLSYVSTFISSLREALKKSADFPVVPIIQFFTQLTASDQSASSLMDVSNICREIAWFLDDLFRKSDLQINQAEQHQIELIISRLLLHPDPSIEREENYDMDSATLSLNCVRGITMHALIKYSLLLNRHAQPESAHDEEPATPLFHPFVRDALESKFDLTLDSSFAVHSVFGWYFPQLHYLDNEWIEANIDRIFPPTADMADYWRVAWEAYIDTSELYVSVFHLLMTQYHRAVNGLSDHSEKKPKMAGNSPERLAEHILIAYLENLIDFDSKDGLLSQLYAHASDELCAHIVFWLSKVIAARKPEIDSELLQRLVSLWNYRIRTAQESEFYDEHRQEISEFMRWLSELPLDFDDVYSFLDASIQFLVDDYDVRLLLEYAAKHSEIHPEETNLLLLQLLELDGLTWFLREEDIRAILRAGVKSRRTRAYQIAVQIINKRGEKGDFRWESLLPS